MKILAIYKHYWPDTTPYARMLRAILENFVTQGHEAAVFTAQPSYNDVLQPKQPRRETLGGVEIQRLSLLPERKRFKLLRAVNFAYFLIRAVCHVLTNRKYDLIVANTHPPVLMGMALRLIKRITGIPFLLHCQDIHPECAVTANQLSIGWIQRKFLAADTKSCRAAVRVVTLSRDMQDQLASRLGYTGDNIEVINNFPLDRYGTVPEVPPTFHNSVEAPFLVLFAGNMGLFQQLDKLITAAHCLRDDCRIQFVFMGAGARRNKLIEQAGDLLDRTVFFESHQPVETAFACMQRSDLGVVSLAEGVYRVAYPSKTMTLLAAGCPLLVLAELHSNLCQEVIDNDFGYVPLAGTPEEIANAIRAACDDRGRWTEKARRELIERGQRHFGREASLAKWNQMIHSLDGNSSESGTVAIQRHAA